MTLSEYANKISNFTLTAWQRELLPKIETAVNEDKTLIYNLPRNNGRTMIKNLVNGFYGRKVI